MVLVGVALMADNQRSDSPSSLTIDKATLKDLTKDTNDLIDYPKWSKTVDQIDTEPSINHGLWAYYKGPPFLQRVTLYSGNDRDLTKGGELVRRILGLPLNFGKWEGNHYLDNFETQQMYFLQSNEHSALVIPPLEQSGQPILSEHAKQMLHQYISVGHNTVIVTGGTGAIDFINKNLIVEGAVCRVHIFFIDELNQLLFAGMTTLEPAWTRGPYEKQVICFLKAPKPHEIARWQPKFVSAAEQIITVPATISAGDDDWNAVSAAGGDAAKHDEPRPRRAQGAR